MAYRNNGRFVNARTGRRNASVAGLTYTNAGTNIGRTRVRSTMNAAARAGRRIANANALANATPAWGVRNVARGGRARAYVM